MYNRDDGDMGSFFTELKRRNVFKVGVAYIIVAWLLIQVADTLLPTFGAPDWVMPVFSAIILLGLPLAVILAWAFELTPEGVKPTSAVNADESITQGTGQRLNLIIIGVMALAIAFLVIDNYVLKDEPVVVSEIASTQAIVEAPVETTTPVEVEEQRQVLSNSVAVLPFENLSPDPNNAYFAAGIHDTILNELAQINDVNVIARTTMLRYEGSDKTLSEIAEELNVETIMEGSVQYANNRVRITAQLIDPITGSHLWSENYDRDFDDIFEIQSDIATRIAAALEAELLPKERRVIERPLTDSAEAYTLYLQAMEHINWDFSPGIRADEAATFHAYLDRAIELDGNFAIAHAAKAVAYGYYMTAKFDPVRGDRSAIDELATLARKHADRALEIDPETGLAYSAYGIIHRMNWEMREALENFESAYELSPNDASLLNDYIFTLAIADQDDKSIQLSERLLKIDPSERWLMRLIFIAAGRLDEALVIIKDGLERNISNLTGANAVSRNYLTLALIELALGNEAEARRSLELAETLVVGQTHNNFDVDLAYVYMRLNEREKAAAIVEKLRSTVDFNQFFNVTTSLRAYLAAGEIDLALELVATHIDYKNPNAISIAYIRDNVFRDPVLEQPEWVALRQGINLSVP
jgi:TolB-like protein/Flp pilus assembly protein TadD